MSNPGDSLDIYGGSSSIGGTGSILFGGGNSDSDIPSGQTGPFTNEYTLIANTEGSLKRVNLTFCNYNDPYKLRIFNSSLNITKQANIDEKIDLSDFFYPIQSFSGYQKQTFVIPTNSSININPVDFDTTLGEVGLFMAKAEYNADATEDEEFLYWFYNGGDRFIMNRFMVLSGQVKPGYSWKGWEVHFDVDSQIGYTGAATGGFLFSNPTQYSVKLTVFTAS